MSEAFGPSTNLDLRDALDALAALAAMSWTSRYADPSQQHCPELMAAIEGLNREATARTIRPSRLERARESWANYENTGHPPESGHLGALCWEPTIASLPDFCTLISRDLPLGSRSLRGLLTSYHIVWSSGEAEMSSILLRSLREMTRARGVMERWAESPDELVGRKSPERFAKRCFDSRVSATGRLTEYGLATTGTFAEEVARQLAGIATSTHAAFSYAVETTFPEDDQLLSPAAWGEAFDRLLAKCGGSIGEAERQAVIDLALRTRGLPDPRLRQAGWQNVPKAARDRVVQWLSEEDLRFFFDLLMEGEEDPQERRAFWLDYIAKADRSRVVVGTQDHQRLSSKFRELKSRGRSYARVSDARGVDARSSAFIMEFGGITIVEFSKAGSACYVYENRGGERHLDLSKLQFHWAELKNPDAGDRYIHLRHRWHHDFRRLLARHGVRP